MKFFIMLASLGMAVLAFISMATIGPAPFDYEAATMEERQAWMDKQAKTFKTSARFFLPSGRGPSELNFRLDEIVSDPASRQMKFNIEVKVPYGARASMSRHDEVMAKICKSYVRTALHEEAIRLTFDFHAEKQGTLSKLVLTPSRCETALGSENA